LAWTAKWEGWRVVYREATAPWASGLWGGSWGWGVLVPREWYWCLLEHICQETASSSLMRRTARWSARAHSAPASRHTTRLEVME